MSPREQLHRREITVATMVWQGKTEQVVKNQLRSVFDKLGVWSRLELALYVSSHGGAAWADAIRQQATGTDGPLVRAQSA
jgi:DNA-binding NarL/FixJ family response regulator